MLVGPFDRRKKRSRCQGCSASHLKCSGETPCSNCGRRRIACIYKAAPKGGQIILIEHGKQSTITTWKPSSGKKKSASPPARTATGSVMMPSPSRLADDSLCFLYYFDVFVRQNSFSGKERTFGDDVKRLAGLHQGPYLMKAMISIGAMQAAKLKALDAPSHKVCLSTALEYYSDSIVGLRDAIDAQRNDDEELRQNVLWTTLFLGLFELINDETGDGWQKHMIHGTARALEASGSSRCRAGPCRDFFVQTRIFEISRTILTNESTFLTRPEWMDLSRQMWAADDACEWRPLDSLLDIMVMISRLRVRAGEFFSTGKDVPGPSAKTEAASICADGFSLQEALGRWYESYVQFPSRSSGGLPHYGCPESPNDPAALNEDDSMLLARIFFAAISIYRSGIFDYVRPVWRSFDVTPPVLAETMIQSHTNSILQLVNVALETTNLSALLFLFPLRIAGARSRTQWQRDWARKALHRIGNRFAAASAVRMELTYVWDDMDLSLARECDSERD